MMKKILGIGFPLIGIIFAASVWGGHFYAKHLVTNGSHVMAVVVEKSQQGGGSGDRNARHDISYVFSVDGQDQVRGKYSIAPGVWEKIVEGAMIEVVFDPAHPERNFPVDENSLESPLLPVVATMFAVLLLGAGILLLSGKSKAGGSCCSGPASTCCAPGKK